MEDVTIVVTTFERPDMVRGFLQSVRRFYPDIGIIVSDNGKKRPELEDEIVNGYGCRYLRLPFDSGVSKSRNKAVNEAGTEYVVVCDDDYEFTEETKLDNFRKVLEHDAKVGVITGELIYYGKKKKYLNNLIINDRDKFWLVMPTQEKEMMEADGVKYHYVDHAYQFLMMRNVPELRWDPNLKCSWEHVEFSIRLKREGIWKLAATPDVVGKHINKSPSKLYWRHRTRMDDWHTFHKKMDYVDNVSPIEKPTHDGKGKRVVPFPEYMYYLIKEKNKNMGIANEANPKRP